MWSFIGPSEWQPGGRRTFLQLFFIGALMMHYGAYAALKGFLEKSGCDLTSRLL